MSVAETSLEGVLIISPQVHRDARGWFMESYNKLMVTQIECDFVQDNHVYTALKGTLRGIHFQYPPMEQAKLIRCVRGIIYDVAVDLRRDSGTFLRWEGVVLSAENNRQLFIPRGFGHAYVTLSDDTEVLYKTDNYYSPEHDRAIRWSDPDIGVDWGLSEPILSDKDRDAPLLRDVSLK